MNRHLYTSALAILLLVSCDKDIQVIDIPEKLSGILLSSKQTTPLSPKEYVDWCHTKSNSLKKKKELDDITFSIFHKPSDYIICMEEGTNDISTKTWNDKVNEIDELDYYDFKIEIPSDEGELLKYKISSSKEYEQRLNYFAFDMQKDLKMLYDSDTVDCVLFHFERAYDIAPYAVFVIGFPKNSQAKERTFFYQDKVFHKGIIKLTYKEEELSHIPKLKTI